MMQILVNGLISGAAIALLAVAFQTVYLPTRVFFIGLAGIYSLAPFLAVTLYSFHQNWLLAAAGAIMSCTLLSLGLEWGNHARLSRRGASEGAQLVASLGIYIVLVQIIVVIWGNDTKILRFGSDSVTNLGGVSITKAQWITLISASILLGTFLIFLKRSELGLRLRALADNPVQFALFGYSVTAHRLLGFGLAGLFAAASSLIRANDIGFDPYIGLHAVLLAVVAVMIGGQSSFLGPVLGALLLGVIRAEVVWFYSARWQEAATFLLLAVFLLVRPQGLIQTKRRLEATQ